MKTKFKIAMMAGGIFGVVLYTYAEVAGLHGVWKALAVVLAASGLDTFWDNFWAWMKKREGGIG
jgi:hypothetical protein